MTGRRIPDPTLVENVVAIQRGATEPNRVVIITGHIDSRVTDPMNATADAPGANDDGSGTAAVIEAARVLSRYRFPGTIVYAALSGEEQGLIGGRILADYARAQGWQVVANLNNDIVGNSCSSDDVCDDANVRIFSEGLRWQGGDALRRAGPQPGRRERFAVAQPVALPRRPRRRSQPRPRRAADLAQRPVRTRRRPYRVPQRRLPGGALLGRDRELQLAAPGPAGPRTGSNMATRSSGWTSPI